MNPPEEIKLVEKSNAFVLLKNDVYINDLDMLYSHDCTSYRTRAAYALVSYFSCL